MHSPLRSTRPWLALALALVTAPPLARAQDDDDAIQDPPQPPPKAAPRQPRGHAYAPVTVLTGADVAAFAGGDLINPAALRGLGPDRVLVLINGKRRHQMARVVVDETVGKGTSGVDLNAIPVAAIERIEILGDSATAHYGPSAIGGVINIVLKQRSGVELEVSGGNYYENDGNAALGLDRASASINAGAALGERGFVNGTLAVRDRGETNRAGIATIASTVDGRAFGGDWWTVDESCPPDEFLPEEIPPCKPVRRLRFGNADGQDLQALYNASYQLADDLALYSFAAASHRTGNTGAGLFLGNGNGRVPAELYPDGYLPTLITTVVDTSITVGARIGLPESWELDVSAGYGRSSFGYDVEGSANVSWYYEVNPATGEIYAETPTEANAGELINGELTANADLTGELDVLAGLHVGAGLELRFDRYQIAEGDPVSYAYGRDNVVDPANPIRNLSSFPLVEDTVGGIQGFPGFDPTAAVDDSRTAWDGYADLEQAVTDWWLLGAGARAQNTQYTGFALVGRLGTRVDLGEHLWLRASSSNGSRSPGVQQIFYSQRATAILPAGLTETVTVGDANPLRSAFRIGQLDPETSLSASAGATFEIAAPFEGTRSVRLSADVYRVDIDDRIELSESVTGEVPAGEVDSMGRQRFRMLLSDNQLGAAQFFVNAVDTRTVGADLRGVWGLAFGKVDVDLSAALHYSETSIEGSDPESELVTDADLFGPIQRSRLEKGDPRVRATLAQLTRFAPIAFRLAFNYYGSVTGKNYMALEDEKVWGAKWLTDASLSYDVIPELTVTVGGDNLFDVFPDEWGAVGREYPEIGYVYGLETLPFGVNGGFYYVTLQARL